MNDRSFRRHIIANKASSYQKDIYTCFIIRKKRRQDRSSRTNGVPCSSVCFICLKRYFFASATRDRCSRCTVLCLSVSSFSHPPAQEVKTRVSVAAAVAAVVLRRSRLSSAVSRSAAAHGHRAAADGAAPTAHMMVQLPPDWTVMVPVNRCNKSRYGSRWWPLV